MGHVRPASAASEAIEAEVLLKVWDVLHPRARGWGRGVGERSERWWGWASEASGGGASERSELTAGGLASSCRRQQIASILYYALN